MGASAAKGFCFGRADFDLWPMSPELMIERLRQLRPRLRRVLAVSADVDAAKNLREPMSKASISMTNVLDGKQAADLAPVVNPEAIVLHFSPSCPSAARAIAAMRANDATRDVPILVLFDRAPEREEAFFTASARDLSAKPNFQFANLPGEMARLLA
jgi:PleD family two-component response regulator